ncbi:MAG TPA: type II toxin-antitoxin system RelE/ParE family toxin [Allosphingosinicella sp.]|nr:type II toxin-antitoxin system RelE/ParE family toxin [Allosphingosinicella sp.]
MIQVREAPEFTQWLSSLADGAAHKRITNRITRVQAGLFGDAKPVGGKIFELRVDHGPGYRIYFARRGPFVVILLCGGAKGSQRRDIERARQIAERTI